MKLKLKRKIYLTDDLRMWLQGVIRYYLEEKKALNEKDKEYLLRLGFREFL